MVSKGPSPPTSLSLSGYQLERMSSRCLKCPSKVLLTSSMEKAHIAEPGMELGGVENTP